MAITLDPTELMDALTFEGTYTHKVPLNKKMFATFKVRSAKEINKLNSDLGKLSIESNPQFETEFGLLTLSYATLEFNGTDLEGMSPYPERYEFLSNFPSPIIAKALISLGEFDSAVNKALEDEETIENF